MVEQNQRRCHLCGSVEENKYCTNTSCYEYTRYEYGDKPCFNCGKKYQNECMRVYDGKPCCIYCLDRIDDMVEQEPKANEDFIKTIRAIGQSVQLVCNQF